MRKRIVTFLCFLLLGMIRAMSVDITQEWKPDFGWEVTCQWILDLEDSLQSVTLSRNKQQFFLFRPETLNGDVRKANSFNLTEAYLSVDCLSTVEKGIEGRCRLTVEPHLPPKKDFSFGCAVSGERPFFKFAEKEIMVEALVRPSAAVMIVTRSESSPATINCTSSGVPAPRIVWTVENQTAPHNFNKSVWNSTSKLWDVWSTFTAQTDAAGKVQCTPEVLKGSNHYRGQSVLYNNTFRIFLDATILTISALSSLLLR